MSNERQREREQLIGELRRGMVFVGYFLQGISSFIWKMICFPRSFHSWHLEWTGTFKEKYSFTSTPWFSRDSPPVLYFPSCGQKDTTDLRWTTLSQPLKRPSTRFSARRLSTTKVFIRMKSLAGIWQWLLERKLKQHERKENNICTSQR